VTYYAGSSGLAPIGIANSNPRIECDGCGLVLNIATGWRAPPKWFLDGKAVPGWKMVRRETPNAVERRDWCPKCKGTARERAAKLLGEP
jgi:hypothetical protein